EEVGVVAGEGGAGHARSFSGDRTERLWSQRHGNSQVCGGAQDTLFYAPGWPPRDLPAGSTVLKNQYVVAILLAVLPVGPIDSVLRTSTHRAEARQTIGPEVRIQVSLAITEAVWVKINVGMSRAQVIRLIGGPAGAYQREP